MPTNFYINNTESSPEQNLVHDLIIESIKFYGIDVYWIPRKASSSADQIFGEDTLSSYVQPYLLEMYVKNVDGFDGEGDFISRFGLQIKDQITLTVSTRRFAQLEAGDRPNEGDLIYFPLNKHLFQIQFVEHESMFYTTGPLPVYDLRCETFAYNNETISTGIPEIDSIATKHAYSNAMPTGTTVDNDAIEARANTVLDFDEDNPFGTF